jgi:hypothetical protein
MRSPNASRRSGICASRGGRHVLAADRGDLPDLPGTAAAPDSISSRANLCAQVRGDELSLGYSRTGPAAETGVGKVDARWRVIFVKMLRGPGSVGATASVRYRDFPCHQRHDRGARRQRVRVDRAVAHILHVWLTLTPTCKACVAGVSPGPPAIRARLQASQSGCNVACNVRNRKLINTRYARLPHPRRDRDA